MCFPLPLCRPFGDKWLLNQTLIQKGEAQMNTQWSMKLFFGFLIVGVALAPSLRAQSLPSTGSKVGCGYYEANTAKLKPAAFVEVADDNAIITGLWKFSFTAKGNANIPDGAPIDAGYVTWHADGTEIMNSGRAPITQSFCMGVWKQTKSNTFKLNHMALSWDASGTTFVGPANIREQVTVDHSGNAYSGTFSITQYDTNGNVLAHVVGVIAAQRITAD